MEFDDSATDATKKPIRDSLMAFTAAQGEADYLNRKEMRNRGIEIAMVTGDGRYKALRQSHRHSSRHSMEYRERC